MPLITRATLGNHLDVRQLSVFLLLFFAVFVRYTMSEASFDNSATVRISSKIRSEPLQYDRGQLVTLSGLSVFLPLYPQVDYGDTIVVKGEVRDDKLVNAKLITLEKREGLLLLRKRIIAFYQRVLPEPHASLIAGMSFGSKASLPKGFWDQLKSSGTAHVVVASGMNVTLIAGFFVSGFIRIMKRRKAVPLAIVGVWVYTLLVGFDAPLVRAAIMGTLALIAQEYGKVYNAWRALFLSALGMLFIWPEWVTDIGFWLSFCATSGLLAFQKPLTKVFRRVPIIVREDLTTTVAAQLAVSPILYIAFGNVNLLSPFINVLILWTVVPITTVGLLAGVVGIIIPVVGSVLLFIIFPLTSWFVFVVSLFS